MTTPPTSFPEPGQDPNWGNQLISAITDRDAIIQAVAEGRVTPAELQAAISGVASDLNAHAQTTRDVHGITDTAGLATTGDMDGISTDLATHTDATQDVHGIADTSQLVTSDGLQDALDGKQDAGDYAAAGHDHDDRYIRTVNNTAPDAGGNVAVEGTATVDTSVGTRVFIGDVMVYGDTGARDMTSFLEPDTVTTEGVVGARCTVQRMGRVVTWIFRLRPTEGNVGSSSPLRAFTAVPFALRQNPTLHGDLGLARLGAGFVAVSNSSSASHLNFSTTVPWPDSAFSITVSYNTATSWPTSLPGSPA